MADTAGVVLAVLLGAVFLAAGTLKLRDPSWRDAARRMGAPPLVSRPLPLVEIVLGALLVVGVAPLVVRGAAAVLLAGFVAVLVRAVRSDDPPVCACFGRWSARPVDAVSLARTMLLWAAALIAFALATV